MKQIFDKFLMDNGIYRAYNANVRVKQIEDPNLYISCAFFWDNTSEGYSFWLDINNRWLKIVLAEEYRYRMEQYEPKQKEEGCSFCNGKSNMESTEGDNWGTIRFLKNESILEVELDAICYECDENIPCYSKFEIKYCPMCGYELSKLNIK